MARETNPREMVKGSSGAVARAPAGLAGRATCGRRRPTSRGPPCCPGRGSSTPATSCDSRAAPCGPDAGAPGRAR
eukprot:14297990-Alexandrium_andersonii.AAC.1